MWLVWSLLALCAGLFLWAYMRAARQAREAEAETWKN